MELLKRAFFCVSRVLLQIWKTHVYACVWSCVEVKCVCVCWVTYDAGKPCRCSTQLECCSVFFFQRLWHQRVHLEQVPSSPELPPSRARDVTHAPLTSAAERATGQTRAHRRISKGGVGVYKNKTAAANFAPALPVSQMFPNALLETGAGGFGWQELPEGDFLPPPPLRSFLPLRGVSNLWREQRKGFFFFFFPESRDSSAVEFETRVACLFMALLKWIKKRQNSY